jgi:hypothetical protein
MVSKSTLPLQHDQIKALEFHTQEYQSHYEKLNWNNADKWILGFENSVSYFATNAGRAIGWLVVNIKFGIHNVRENFLKDLTTS